VRTTSWTLLFLVVAAVPTAAGQTVPKASGNWPQWRGPKRDNLSADRNLLKTWPEGGPPLFWEVHGLGTGIAAVAVSGGRVFTVGYLGDSEYLTALDEFTGRRLWAAKTGPLVPENSLMRWLGQRTPTVDGDRVYASHTNGLLVCFQSATGKELWRKDYVKDFGAAKPGWGFCDRPLVDGDRLICAPGGTIAVAALDKATGTIVWKSDVKGGPAHAATVISEAAGVRQVVAFLYGKISGIRASDGKHLWTYEDFGRTGCSCTPIPRGDTIVATAGYGVGLAMLKLSAAGTGASMELDYTQKLDISPFQDSGLVLGSHLFLVGGGARTCVDLAQGKAVWSDHSTGKGLASMTYADGHLYVHHSDGTVALIEANPEKFVATSSFKIAGWQQATGATNPVVTGGRLYIRNESRLLCFDVRETALSVERSRPAAIQLEAPDGKAAAPPPAQAIYVPSPQDVVEKMLQAAGLEEGQTMVDLGSGDGRIVITAARKYRATAVGYEIDEQLVKESRAAIEKAGLRERASIELKDMFTSDLSGANVVAAYLPERFLERLIPQFEKMGPGTRLVTHQFRVPGMEIDATHRMESKDDGDTHAIYVYTMPFRRKKD
jgi:outer membrane protein assembly factor BamB